jgi:transposase-like protein
MDKYLRLRGIAKDSNLSPGAQLRLEWMIFYQKVAKKDVSKTAEHFGISRKTLHKWLSRFKEQNLRTLEEYSRRPKHTREWEITKPEEERIVFFKKKALKVWEEKTKDTLPERVWREYLLLED